ncbi:hypothetical protein PFLU3_17880 [Pseudomonas fluorescens]|uniref:Uncharacterized protein n=1 Tax=Pseudomonas fluorescens TaxID=294 RepID=A0A0D0TKY5_PSEFL|nr:hypothetical protein PFLU3_17880 [Pseudomonas fluorescens]
MQLAEEPQALLGEGQGKQAFASAASNRLGNGRGIFQHCQRDTFGNTSDRRSFKYHTQRQLDTKPFLQALDQAQRHQRMPAQISKKVIVHLNDCATNDTAAKASHTFKDRV